MAQPTQQHAIGRRKTSVARVYLRPGTGNVLINKRELKEYFPLSWRQNQVLSPLALLEVADTYDVLVNVKGGGLTGQAEAIRLGIARALVKENEESKPALRAAGFMTRDARAVERKKYGQPKARKNFQFSKR